METFLRCFANATPSKWFEWLHLAEFWYNTSWHSALNQSPFFVLYGHSPWQLGLDDADACTVDNLEDWLQQKSLMQSLIQQHLARAKNRMKMQADKNRTERSFSVGSWVYVKLQPYVQTSIANRASQKLSFHFFGPYLITEKIGNVAYRLQLPESSTVHPVFHVSQLKAAIPVSHTAQPLPDIVDGLQVPERVLQKRVVTSGTEVHLQGLIQWSGLAPSLATWEDMEALRQCFPRAPAWGQAGPQQGGDVSNMASHAAVPGTANNNNVPGNRMEDGPRSARERRPSSRNQGPEWA
jgi:hypothetical protein